MTTIVIQETEYSYDESDVINFDEGLIGLPDFNRAALVALPEYAPFCWLASVDNPNKRLLVVDPQEIFEDFNPAAPPDSEYPLNLKKQPPQILSIVKISSDWTQTTINLRAPIFVNSRTKRGAQSILSDTNYKLNENLPSELFQEPAREAA